MRLHLSSADLLKYGAAVCIFAGLWCAAILVVYGDNVVTRLWSRYLNYLDKTMRLLFMEGSPRTIVRWQLGIILGILGLAMYKDFRAQMNSGDTLVLYSDGVTEAVNTTDVDFGEDRLGKLTASLKGRPASEVVATIQSEVAKFAAGAPQADDITLVVAKVV